MATKKESDKKLPQSDTIIIKRSQINFAPYNPKRHSEHSIKQQLKNFKAVGFLGGIVWNATTGNLISGHKRIMALDIHYKNNSENPIDYDVKVERVNLDKKQEMEQNIFMDSRSTNSEQQYDLLAEMLPLVDIELAGLDAIELDLILAENPQLEDVILNTGSSEEIKKDYDKIEKTAEQKKEAIKELKKQINESIDNAQGESYVTLSFDSYEHKAQFLDAMGYDTELIIIKGETLFQKINDKQEVGSN